MYTRFTSIVALLSITFCGFKAYGQSSQPYTASFIGRMGTDTVLVETYTMVNNHLYGKAFIRVPEDYIGEFSVHFYPDGSIREFNVAAMDPFISSVPFKATSGDFEYRLNMNCKNDTCTFYNSMKGKPTEIVISHAVSKVDFVGGWVPFISLMEWNSMRLAKSGKTSLPLKMINHNIGVYDIGVQALAKDSIAFGGPFLEYTQIKTDPDGKILETNGIGTPWNYYVSRHEPINIDLLAARMAKTPGIGIPSPTETFRSVVHNNKIEVSYGRPYKRGRKIFGGVVPYDSVWRTGANLPTKLTLEKNIRIGKTLIPKGQYSLYTIPRQNEWLLIFNTDLNRWPTDPDRQKDFAQVVLPVTKLGTPIEQFSIEVQETKKGGILVFQWDDTMAYADFKVVDL
ncbi:hypothetical protein D770_13255 [Flammeovirgaceae bacterium 311]|nr:hypothetical protein D770_13255 [Flammeovirgaceae bacterium 311]